MHHAAPDVRQEGKQYTTHTPHCTAPQEGSGWCPFADIYLAVHALRTASGGGVCRVLVVDLDVHQGNGVGRCKLNNDDSDLVIADAYNGQIFPKDSAARRAIGSACVTFPRDCAPSRPIHRF